MASLGHNELTHQGWVLHIWTIIGSDNSLLSVQHKAIVWTNAGIFFIGPLRTISVRFESKYEHSYSWKSIWKVCLQKDNHFASVFQYSDLFLWQNLSPVLTKMTKEVDSREKELTHQVHRDWLVRSLDNVKQLTPVLISGIKIYITTVTTGNRASNLVAITQTTILAPYPSY